MKRIITIFLWVISVSVFAQTQNISGVITDLAGEPVPGVTIVVKGTTTGTITNVDGNFSISDVSSNTVLVFSFVGMTTQEITVGNQSTIAVTMVADAVGLDEVVVIGYGTVRKSDLTGSVSTVDTKEAYVAPVASMDNALQGRAAGVQVTASSGAPGSTATIRIRGGNSISAGNEPLYVIDGFVGAGNISSINPNDIESMQILKDASSTAIYGARGTNGVVIITTKKGKLGKPVVNFKSSYGIQQLPEKVDVQTGREFAEFINSADTNPADGLPFDLNNLPGQETDWQDVMIDPAPISDYQLSVSGGNENSEYYMSAGYLSQEGIVRGTGFKRYSLRSNVDTRLSKAFKTGLSLSLSRTQSNNNNITFFGLIRQDPLMPVYDSEGNYNGLNYGVSNSQNNPLADNELNQNETFRDRALINTYIQASLLDDKIILRSTFGGDFLFSKQHQFIPSTNPTSIRNGRLGKADINRFNDMDFLNENTINYSNTFDDHSFGAVGGITFQSQKRETVIIAANEIPSDGVGVNAIELAPVEETSINSNYSEFSLFSLLGRINYSYKNKYLFTATIRRDGSSRLGVNNKFAVFPSAAIAWKMSEEPFIQNIKAIDNLKLRTSYGVTGNQGIDPFSTLSTFNTLNTAAIMNGVPVAGVEQGTLASPDLKWETTKQYDLGIEFSLFKGRFSGEIDFYYKKTEDLLLAAEVPFFTGFTTTIQNVGSLENKGVDLNLNTFIFDTKDFGWDMSLNISNFKNKVLGLGDKTFIATNRLPAPSSDTNSQLIVGEPVGVFWGAIFEGIDPATGNAIFADVSGPNGVPDGAYDPVYDKTVIGNANPDFYGGFQTNFRYKNFDLNAFFPFSVGNENYNEEAFLVNELQINSFSQLRNNIWTPENPNNASVPGFASTSFNTSNSFFVQDASFFRLGTLQLGYVLPSNLINGISKIRVYCTGSNLFLIKSKDYLGYDPDVSSYGDSNTLRGFDRLAYPQNRSFLAGIDITF